MLEDIKHLKIGCSIVKLPVDRVQTFVFQNEEWQISDKNINYTDN